MKKKIITLLLTTSAVLSLVGCGSKYEEYVTLGDYKNMTITDSTNTISSTKNSYSKEDIESHIRASICLYSPDLIKQTNEPITKDNCISFEGTVTDESGNESNFALSNKMVSELSDIKGLDEGVLNHKVGDTIKITLPLDTGTLTANIKIISVSNDPLTLFNNDWVKKYDSEYNCKTTDEYYKAIEKHLKSEAKENEKSTKISLIANNVLENAKVKKYPEESINKEIKNAKAQYSKMEELYNIDIKENIMTNNNLSSDEDYKNFLESIAKEQVKENLVYNRIAEIEKLNPTEKEYEEKIKEYKSEHKDSYDSYDVVGEEHVKQYILNDIVEDWLYENNTVKTNSTSSK